MTHTLTGRYPLGDLTGRDGEHLRFTPSTTIVGDDNIILPAPVPVTLDSGGAFSVELVGTDDVAYAPSGWVWVVQELMDGGRAPWAFELTADSDLSELAATTVPGSYVTLVPTARTLTAGAGLTGGGTLAADRTFNVGAGTGVQVNTDSVEVVYGSTAGTAAEGSALTTEVAARAAADSAIEARTITAGSGLTGGGSLAASRTLAVGAGTGITVNADDVALDLTYADARYVNATELDAQSLLGAVTDDTPTAIAVAASRFVGRKATGDVGAMTVAEAKALLALAVADITGAAPAADPTFTGTVTIPTPAANSNTTVAASTAFAVERATVGNLLTTAQATPSTGAYTVAGCTEASGVFTATGSGALTGAATITRGIAVGQVMTMMATLAPVGRSAATRISWRNGANAEISAVAGDTIAASATGTSMAVGVAPAGTVTAVVYAAYSGTGATSDTVTVTKPSFHAGYSGSWVLPGVPVPNLGRRARRPLTDNIHVTVWSDSLGAPVTVRYDTGWRNVTADVLNSWTVTTMLLRRINDTVYFWADGLTNRTSFANCYLLPSGFKNVAVSLNVEIVSFGRENAITGNPCWVRCYLDEVIKQGGMIGGTWNNASYKTSFQHIFTTSEVYPTSLPGTLHAAAPA